MGLTLTGSMNISGKEELAAGMAFAAANKDEVVINGLSEQFALGGGDDAGRDEAGGRRAGHGGRGGARSTCASWSGPAAPPSMAMA